MIYRMVPFSMTVHGPWVSSNPDFKGTPFGIEQDTRQRRYKTDRLLLQTTTSDMWLIELYHHQWPWSTFKVISLSFHICFCVKIFQYLIENPGNVAKSGKIQHIVRSGTSYVSNYCYSTAWRIRPEGSIWHWTRSVRDS